MTQRPTTRLRFAGTDVYVRRMPGGTISATANRRLATMWTTEAEARCYADSHLLDVFTESYHQEDPT